MTLRPNVTQDPQKVWKSRLYITSTDHNTEDNENTSFETLLRLSGGYFHTSVNIASFQLATLE
eukprot:2579983-Amphidinium_carterae.1